MSTAIVLPYDPEGTNPENRRENEQHVVSPPAAITDMSVIIPRLAPFHAASMVVSIGTAENRQPLTAGVDYQFVYRHHSATKATGMDVYGGILFTNRAFNGNVWLDYQSIGGVLTLDDLTIVERFSRSIHNVMWASWEQFTGLPSAWPVADHPVDGAMLYNLDMVGNAIVRVAAAIEAKNSGAGSEPIANEHIVAPIAHVPSQVGLSNLNNWNPATANDFNVGTNNAYATAFGVKTYLDSRLSNLAVGALEDRIDELETDVGQHGISIGQIIQTQTNIANEFDDVKDDMADTQLLVGQQNIAIQNVTDAVGGLSADVAQNTTKIGQHTTKIGQHTTSISQNTAKIGLVEDDVEALAVVMDARNPTGRVPDGTHVIMLEPTKVLNLTMVANGGFGGKVVDDLLDYVHRQPALNSAELWLCDNFTTGERLAEPLLLCQVIAGQSGEYTLSTSSRFGVDGIAGTAVAATNGLIETKTVTDGTAGGNGSVDEIATAGGPAHSSGFGAGKDGEVAAGVGTAGAGGSGGSVEMKLKNTSTHTLKLILVSSVQPAYLQATQVGHIILS